MGEPQLKVISSESEPASRDAVEAAPTNAQPGRSYWRMAIVIGLIVAALAALYSPARSFADLVLNFETTDDAQVGARVVTLSTKIGGIVSAVHYNDHARVKKNDLLVELDARDIKNTIKQLTAELNAAKATHWNAKINLDRTAQLLKKKYVAEKIHDAAVAHYHETLGKYWAISAQLDQAELNLTHTKLYAPADGVVGRRTIEPGSIIKPLQPVTSFVDSRERWVNANFKETQLRNIQLGQDVDVEIDAVAGKTFHGRVESMAPGSGSTFALIPAENATGNFTKVVQRVPMKIVLDPESLRGFEGRLVPGLSAFVKLRIPASVPR